MIWSKPEGNIKDMTIKVKGLGLDQGADNSLVSKLENAIKSLEKDNDNAAVNQLKAFINGRSTKTSLFTSEMYEKWSFVV